jgi:hypothetical protein
MLVDFQRIAKMFLDDSMPLFMSTGQTKKTSKADRGHAKSKQRTTIFKSTWLAFGSGLRQVGWRRGYKNYEGFKDFGIETDCGRAS